MPVVARYYPTFLIDGLRDRIGVSDRARGPKVERDR
jgi:hypothetical protein